MARVTHDQLTCDVCDDEVDVAAVSVTIDGSERAADLCATHRQQLQLALAGLLNAPPQPTGRGRPIRGRKAATAGKVADDGVAAASPARQSVAPAATGRAGRPMPVTTCPHCGLQLGVQNLSRHIAARHPTG